MAARFRLVNYDNLPRWLFLTERGPQKTMCFFQIPEKWTYVWQVDTVDGWSRHCLAKTGTLW